MESKAGVAWANLGEVQKRLAMMRNQAQEYAPEAKKKALEEAAKLQATMKEAQVKANTIKALRQDFTERITLKEVVPEVESKLKQTEEAVEKAEVKSKALAEGGEASEEASKEFSELVTAAQTLVSTTQNLIQSKKRCCRTGGPLLLKI